MSERQFILTVCWICSELLNHNSKDVVQILTPQPYRVDCEFDKECTRMFFDLIDRRYNKESNFNVIFDSDKNLAL